MSEIFRIFGMRFFFYSREHEPMHVHVENANGKAKFIIHLDKIELVESKGMKPNDLKMAEAILEEILTSLMLIQAILEENKEVAILEWNKHFGNKR